VFLEVPLPSIQLSLAVPISQVNVWDNNSDPELLCRDWASAFVNQGALPPL